MDIVTWIDFFTPFFFIGGTFALNIPNSVRIFSKGLCPDTQSGVINPGQPDHLHYGSKAILAWGCVSGMVTNPLGDTITDSGAECLSHLGLKQIRRHVGVQFLFEAW